MKPWRLSIPNIVISALIPIILSLVCMLVQHSSTIFANLVRQDIPFAKVDGLHWVADLSSLPAGNYYVSAGRPKGECILKSGDTTLDHTDSVIPGMRESLLLGASISRSDSPTAPALSIECKKNTGFPSGLSHGPVLASYRSGIILQYWRALSETLLGPLSSVFLVLVILAGTFTKAAEGSPRRFSRAFILFAAACFAYSLSLAHYPRLLIHELWASALHIALRATFGAAFLSICARYSRQRTWLTAINLAVVPFGFITAHFTPDLLDKGYDLIYPVFWLTTAVSLFDLFTVNETSESAVVMRHLAATWMISQFLDSSIAGISIGIYAAPATITLIAIAVGVLKIREDARILRIESATRAIMDASKAATDPKEAVAAAATLLHEHTHFARMSAYVDAFTIGAADQPLSEYYRINEQGYVKDTSADRLVEFSMGRGQVMKEAIEANKVIFRKGSRDESWFACIPVGPHACINLSDFRPSSDFYAYQSLEMIERLAPALSGLSDRLIEHGTKLGYALEKLRSKNGDKNFKTELGAVFVDVNDYSVLTEEYGERFSRFVAEAYLPALAKAVRTWAVPEFSRGDELYLVCVPDLIRDGRSPARAAQATVVELMKFSRTHGAVLCRENGFEPLSLSIGANSGEAWVICDSLHVRTSGEVINEAARLASRSPQGGAIIHTQMAAQLNADETSLLGEEVSVLCKKNFVRGRSLAWNRVA